MEDLHGEERLITGEMTPGVGRMRPRPVSISANVIRQRISKLSTIQDDLSEVIQALAALEYEAKAKEHWYQVNKRRLAATETDLEAAQALLSVPEAAFTRLMGRASRQGLMWGVIIGLLTGITSSYAVWYWTK